MSLDLTRKNETEIIRKVYAALEAGGWTYIGTDDGDPDGELVEGGGVEMAIETVHSVDMSTLFFEKEGKRKGIFLICGNGNDGLDLISDHSVGMGFDEIIDSVTRDEE